MGNKSSKSKYKQQLASGQHLQVLYQQDYIQRTRLGVAIEAIANYFLHNFKGDDGFALATFSTYYKSAESRDAVGNGVIEAEQPLWDLAEITPVGATRLYSSIKDAVDEFEKIGSAGRPWVLIVLTDGDDNRSQSYTAEGIGKYVRKKFTDPYEDNPNPNYVFVVGVGANINPATLQRMGPSRNFRISHVRDFALLQVELALIAYEISYGTQLHIGEGIDSSAIWAEVEHSVHVRETPIDVMFLLDISESMGWVA